MPDQALLTLKLRSTGSPIASAVKRADTFATRLRGLLFRPPLSPDEGLIISPCNQVHMFFMTFPIDVIFCSAEMEVMRCHSGLKPWRITSICHGAKYAVEIASGKIEELAISAGDFIDLA